MEYYSAIKKECIWVSFNEVDEPRAYYTEWSKSEREKQILCTNTYIRIYRDGTDEVICKAAVETPWPFKINIFMHSIPQSQIPHPHPHHSVPWLLAIFEKSSRTIW